MTVTVAQVAKASLQRILVQASEADLEPDEYQDYIFALNNYMLALDAEGISLGYTVVSGLADELTIPVGALRGVIANMAIEVAPDYNGVVSPGLLVAAKDGMRAMRKLGQRIAATRMPCTLPFGSGNEYDSLRYDRYYPCSEAKILAETTGAIGLEGLTDAIAGGQPPIGDLNPLITVLAALNDFTGDVGTPSAEQAYFVSAQDLSVDLDIIAPTDFEISLVSGGVFTQTLALTPSAGVVATTTVYVRMVATTPGNVGGDIKHISAGAATVNQAVAGIAVAVYTTTGKTIKGGAPDQQRYEKSLFWTGANGSLLSAAIFLRIPAEIGTTEALIFGQNLIGLFTKEWKTGDAFNQFRFDFTDTGGNGASYLTDGNSVHGLVIGQWFALMVSIDYTAATPVKEVWVHGKGDASATKLAFTFESEDAGPITFFFDDNSSIVSMGDHPFLNAGTIESSEVYFTDEYIDWSVQANRDKYVNAQGKPVGLGVDGSDLTGTIPRFYFPDSDATNNVGSAGNFTEIGTIENSPTSPTD